MEVGMRVVAASDWRDDIPFETPIVLADAIPGEPARCSTCGGSSDPLPRTELWAVKHRHPKNHDGFVRFYCAEHRPAVKAPADGRPGTAGRPGTGAARAAGAERRPAAG
ncbi:MAG: glucose-6-phosphate dehydrogenase, partial [Microbacterium sp.]